MRQPTRHGFHGKAGKAADALIAAHVPAWADGNAGIEAGMTAPPVAETVTFTRPVYPFPFYARYRGRGRGRGDVNAAGSFRPALSKAQARHEARWMALR